MNVVRWIWRRRRASEIRLRFYFKVHSTPKEDKTTEAWMSGDGKRKGRKGQASVQPDNLSDEESQKCLDDRPT